MQGGRDESMNSSSRSESDEEYSAGQRNLQSDSDERMNSSSRNQSEDEYSAGQRDRDSRDTGYNRE
jgi:hypothetical protein